MINKSFYTLDKVFLLAKGLNKHQKYMANRLELMSSVRTFETLGYQRQY